MATTPQTNVTLAEFAEALDRFESFALCGHVSPDGDCLGSQLALAHALRAKGKRAVCLLAHDDAVDKSFLFLPGANELIPACEFESDVDAFIAVDVPNLERLGDAVRVHESARARISRLITMRLKAAWQNTITSTPMRRQRACLRGALLAKWELSARSRWLSAAIWP